MPVTIYNTGTGAPIYGSIVGQSVTFSGATPYLHYDLALRSPTSTTYTLAAPLQYGAAFDNLSTHMTYTGLVFSTK